MTRATGAAGGAELLVWGAGGSAPCGRAARAGFGGDTVCFEMRRPEVEAEGGGTLLLDLGSGARDAGRAISARAAAAGLPARVEVLLTHLHLDHVIGAPFFQPFYEADAEVRVTTALMDAEALDRRLGRFASPPWFPVEPMQMGAARWHGIAPEDELAVAGFTARPIRLTHPGGCFGWRVDGPDGAVALIGDHEHGEPAVDAALEEAVRGVDVMLFDGTYDASEYPKRVGWGHSTWQWGAELAARAGIALTLVHHHQPEHDDATLEARDAEVRAAGPGIRLARQGMRVRLRAGAAPELV